MSIKTKQNRLDIILLRAYTTLKRTKYGSLRHLSDEMWYLDESVSKRWRNKYLPFLYHEIINTLHAHRGKESAQRKNKQ